MESPAQTAIGASIVVLAVVATAVFLDGGTDIGGVLLFVGYALGGILMVLAGTGRTVEAGTRTVERRHFLGGACVVIALGFAPFAVHALTDSVSGRAWGIAAGIGALSLLWIGVSYLTGRIEPTA